MPKDLFETRITTVAASWISTPFFECARKKHVGVDCLGLVLGVWEEVNSAICDVPPNRFFPRKIQADFDLVRANLKHIAFEIDFATKQSGDVICFQLAPNHWHLAFLTFHSDHETLIHARSSIGVVQEDYSKFWKSRLHSIYRLTET